MSGETTALQFVDTNVLIYAHDRSAGRKHEVARILVGKLWDARVGCLSIQVLQEFYVTVTQKITQPLQRDEAVVIIQDLQFWTTHSPKTADILDAIALQQTYRLSFWDAMVIQSAMNLHCSQILSEDLNHGQRFGEVQVVNPFL